MLRRFVPCRLNKCGVISPRYDLRHGDIETWIAKLLPSRLVSGPFYIERPTGAVSGSMQQSWHPLQMPAARVLHSQAVSEAEPGCCVTKPAEPDVFAAAVRRHRAHNQRRHHGASAARTVCGDIYPSSW